MYGLRKIFQHGRHCGFQWPLEVGAIAKAPDWNPAPVCGGGLHFLPEAKGDFHLLLGHYWCVIEFDEIKMVRINKHKAKVEECKIVFLSESTDGLITFFDHSKWNEDQALNWAYFTGDSELVLKHIKSPRHALYWAQYIGNHDIMKRIVAKSSIYTFEWNNNFPDDKIIPKVKINTHKIKQGWALK